MLDIRNLSIKKIVKKVGVGVEMNKNDPHLVSNSETAC